MKNAFNKLVKVAGITLGVLVLIGMIAAYTSSDEQEMANRKQERETKRIVQLTTEQQAAEKARLAAESKARAEQYALQREAEKVAADAKLIETKLVNEIKQTMHNPDSFKLVESRCQPNYQGNKYLMMVAIKFRGTNAFGAIVTNYKFAVLDRNTRTYREIDQSEL